MLCVGEGKGLMSCQSSVVSPGRAGLFVAGIYSFLCAGRHMVLVVIYSSVRVLLGLFFLHFIYLLACFILACSQLISVPILLSLKLLLPVQWELMFL